MAENRFPTMTTGNPRETVCIDTNRVCDSCRDRDCFENARVYLSEFGSEILERTGAIRPKSAEILWTHVTLEEVPFNRGFYAVNIRFYIRITCEACTGGARSQDVEGLCILEKKVILYGGEGNAAIFRSGSDNSFCPGFPDEDDFGVSSSAADKAAAVQETTAFLPDYAFSGSDNAVGTSVSGVVGSAMVAGMAVLICVVGGFFRKKKAAGN